MLQLVGFEINCFKIYNFFRYKFVLAFEDALCRDYATETFFSVLATDGEGEEQNEPFSWSVPIVLGGGANHSALAPPHSFVNAGDFSGPKHLARFLKLLDADDARYFKHILQSELQYIYIVVQV